MRLSFPSIPRMARTAHALAPSIVLFAASFAYRLPALLHAHATNSDAAVVGLQAMHILRGEFAAFLWGSGYQTSVDSFVCAAWFYVFGSSPLALMLSSLSLHVLATWLVFATLRRHFSPWIALLLTMPLIVSPSSVHSYALYPPRQASLTLALAAFWAIDAAFAVRESSDAPPVERRRRRWLFGGGLLATLAVAADPYPLILLPPIGLFALLTAWFSEPNGTRRFVRRARSFGSFGIGALVGVLPFLLIHRLAGAKSGPLGLSLGTIAHNFRLLREECLPWALSYKAYFPRHAMDYRPWEAPLAFRVVGVIGALLVAGLVLVGLVGPFAPLSKRLPRGVTNLGASGALAFPVTIVGFLLSVMVMDHFSMRYLAALTLMMPFAVAPAAKLLGGRRFTAAFAPHLVASAIAGWVSFGPLVEGPLPVAETSESRDDFALFDLLHQKRVVYAEADYWTAYRLTFLFDERIVVVPIHDANDRYAPYREAFRRAPTYAYVFDPDRSQENVEAFERELTRSSASVERSKVGRLDVLVVHRSGTAALSR